MQGWVIQVYLNWGWDFLIKNQIINEAMGQQVCLLSMAVRKPTWAYLEAEIRKGAVLSDLGHACKYTCYPAQFSERKNFADIV